MSAAERYQRLSPDEETSPCSLQGVMNQYVRDEDQSHVRFMQAIGMNGEVPRRFHHVSSRTSVYLQLKQGKRDLVWCPENVGILSHLEPFFLSRGMRMGIETMLDHEHPIVSDAIHAMIKQERSQESWMISWNFTDEYAPATASGFFTREFLPDMIQAVLLIARAIFLGYPVPFASSDPKRLTFARTGTLIGETERLAVAYVPGRAVYIRTFDENEIFDNLVNPGIVPVILI